MESLNEQRLYRCNIKVNYAYFFLMSLSITRGFWMIYLASKGMSLVELGILEGMFHITSFVMETPTGAIADLFGRKHRIYTLRNWMESGIGSRGCNGVRLSGGN